MRRVVAAAVGLLAMLGARPSWGGGVEPVRLPDGSELAAVEFDRHVASLFGRLGCNAGSCHGSFQGRGGLNLSLFGHDPARDFQAIAREASGRRVNVLDPDRSLVLLKATGQVPHEGGQRFTPGSWEYRVIRAWIADGARRDPARPAARAIAIRPRRIAARTSGRDRPARGRRALRRRHGSRRHPVLRPPRPRRPSRRRLEHGGRPGPPARRHRGRRLVPRPARRGPRPRPDRSDRRRSPMSPPSDIIDREVYAKLRALGIEPSGPADGRRVPPPGHARRDRHPADAGRGPRLPRRRVLPTSARRTIDRLLAHPMHAALWATRFLDITGCDVDAMEGPAELRARRARMWHDWFRKRFAANMPYDQIARGVLCATSRDGEDARAWARREAERTAKAPGRGRDRLRRRSRGSTSSGDGLPTGNTSRSSRWPSGSPTAFLGVRIECAQCHKHPFDRWTQADYRSFANIFADVQFGLSPDGLAAAAALLDERRKADPKRRPAADPSAPRGLSRRPGPPAASPTPPPAARSPRGPGWARAARRRRPPRAALRLAGGARQPLLRPQLRQPRLGGLLRRGPGRPGRWLLGRQPALEPAAARRPGGRLRRPRLRHPPARADDPELPGLPALLAAGRGQPRRPGQLRPVDAEAA